jgi:hypothetical protein
MWIIVMTGSSESLCNERREPISALEALTAAPGQSCSNTIRSPRHDRVYATRTSGVFRLLTAGARFTACDDITCWTLGDHPRTLRDLGDFGSKISSIT